MKDNKHVAEGTRQGFPFFEKGKLNLCCIKFYTICKFCEINKSHTSMLCYIILDGQDGQTGILQLLSSHFCISSTKQLFFTHNNSNHLLNSFSTYHLAMSSHPHPSVSYGGTIFSQAQHKQVHLVLSAPTDTEAKTLCAFLQLHRKVVIVLQERCRQLATKPTANKPPRNTTQQSVLGPAVPGV